MIPVISSALSFNRNIRRIGRQYSEREKEIYGSPLGQQALEIAQKTIYSWDTVHKCLCAGITEETIMEMSSAGVSGLPIRWLLDQSTNG